MIQPSTQLRETDANTAEDAFSTIARTFFRNHTDDGKPLPVILAQLAVTHFKIDIPTATKLANQARSHVINNPTNRFQR